MEISEDSVDDDSDSAVLRNILLEKCGLLESRNSLNVARLFGYICCRRAQLPEVVFLFLEKHTSRLFASLDVRGGHLATRRPSLSTSSLASLSSAG